MLLLTCFALWIYFSLNNGAKPVEGPLSADCHHTWTEFYKWTLQLFSIMVFFHEQSAQNVHISSTLSHLNRFCTSQPHHLGTYKLCGPTYFVQVLNKGEDTWKQSMMFTISDSPYFTTPVFTCFYLWRVALCSSLQRLSEWLIKMVSLFWEYDANYAFCKFHFIQLTIQMFWKCSESLHTYRTPEAHRGVPSQCLIPHPNSSCGWFLFAQTNVVHGDSITRNAESPVFANLMRNSSCRHHFVMWANAIHRHLGFRTCLQGRRLIPNIVGADVVTCQTWPRPLI